MSTPYVFRPTASPQEAANWSTRQILATDPARQFIGPMLPWILEDLAAWEFRPATRNGAPIDVEAVIELPVRKAQP